MVPRANDGFERTVLAGGHPFAPGARVSQSCRDTAINCDFVRRELENWCSEKGELIFAVVHFKHFLVCGKRISMHCDEAEQLLRRWKCRGDRYGAEAARRGVTVAFPTKSASIEVEKITNAF